MGRHAAAIFFFSTVLAVAQTADPAALLDRAATKAREAETLLASGATVVEYLSEPGLAAETVRFRLIEKPKMMRMDLSGGHPLSVACGVRKPMVYFRDTSEVQTEGITGCTSIRTEWSNLPSMLTELKASGTKRISMDGGERECTVLSGEFLPRVLREIGLRGTPPDTRSLCIETATGAILWYQTERTVSRQPNSVRVRETTTFSQMDWGAPIFDDDFDIEVPPGARVTRNGKDRIVWPRNTFGSLF